MDCNAFTELWRLVLPKLLVRKAKDVMATCKTCFAINQRHKVTEDAYVAKKLKERSIMTDVNFMIISEALRRQLNTLFNQEEEWRLGW